MNFRYFAFAAAFLVLAPQAANAACSGYPAGVNNAFSVVAFTNSSLTSKQEAVTAYGADGILGMVVYDSTANRLKVCDGSNWQTLSVTNCPAGYTPNSGSCYRAYASSQVWTAARNICNADGADLAVINDATENAYVNALANTTAFWIGTTDTAVEGTFAHVDNTALAYTNWNTSQPNDGGGNEDCVESGTAQTAKWNDATCTNAKYFVCEKLDATATAGADNLGNHLATQNVRLGSNWLSGDGGNEGLAVDANGNVGIGTTSPSQKLDVAGNAAVQNLYATATAVGTPPINANMTTGSLNARLGSWSANDAALALYSSAGTLKTLLFSNGDSYLTGGNVGIGTAAPQKSLHVQTPTTAGLQTALRLSHGGASVGDSVALEFFPADGVLSEGAKIVAHAPGSGNVPLAFYTSNAGAAAIERLRVDYNGNLGIGTTTPQTKLDFGGSGVTQSTSTISARGTSTGNAFEWGHQNQAGYASTLGFMVGGGQPYICLSCEAGTTGNTFRTRGLKGSVIWSDNGGALVFSRVATASADNQTSAESMRIDASGNVGIGTTGPNSRLESYIPAAASSADWEKRNITATQGISTANRVYTGYDMLDLATRAASIGYGYDSTGYFMALGTNDNTSGDPIERVRIDRNGNVGIGTMAPGAKLHVSANNNSFAQFGPNTTYGASLYVGSEPTGRPASGSGVASVATSNGNLHLDAGTGQNIYIGYYTATNTLLNPNGGNVGIGTASPANYKLVIDSAANNAAKIGILTLGRSGSEYPSVGYNVRYGGTSGAYTYDGNDTASMIRFQSGKVETFTAASGTTGSSIGFTTGPYVAQGGTTWSAGSDVRLKKNIHPITVLDKLDGYRAVSFDWKETGKHDLGVIAQEIYKVFPDVVDKGDDDPDAKITSESKGKWGVQYDKLGALALQAVKELKAANDNQADEIRALRDEFRAYKAAHP